MLNILIILVMKQIRLPLRGRPILLITRMITYKPITYESGVEIRTQYKRGKILQRVIMTTTFRSS